MCHSLLVTSSDAPVPSSDALVTSSFLLFFTLGDMVCQYVPEANLGLVASSYGHFSTDGMHPQAPRGQACRVK